MQRSGVRLGVLPKVEGPELGKAATFAGHVDQPSRALALGRAAARLGRSRVASIADCRAIVNMSIGPLGGDLRISATRVSSASAAVRASGVNGTALAGGGCGGRCVAVGVGTTVGVGVGKT